MRSLTFLLVFFLFLSCRKKNTEVVPDLKDSTEEVRDNKPIHFVSSDIVSTHTTEEVKAIAQLSGFEEVAGEVVSGVSTFKIKYSTKYKNTSVVASGLLHIPINLNQPAPILSYQHGTTFRKSDAPSEKSSGVELLASTGYIVLEPDYLGYGASKDLFHPYYDKEHSASTVLDFIKAAKEFLTAEDIETNNQLFLAGFSEGGYVTLAAQEAFEANPISGIDLTAVAAGAGGFDLNGMLDLITNSTSYTYPAYLAFIITSFDTTYNWSEDFDYYFEQEYASKFPEIMDGTKGGSDVNRALTTNIADLLNPDFFTNIKNGGEAKFKQALTKNSLTDWKAETPLRLYHGTEDEIIPLANTEATYQSLLAKGSSDVELKVLPGAKHGTSAKPMILDFLPWFNSFE